MIFPIPSSRTFSFSKHPHTDPAAFDPCTSKDIHNTLGTDKFPRLRFGIGNNYPKGRQVEFVLGKWLSNEVDTVKLKIEKCIDIIENFVSIGIEQTMNEVNKLSIQA